MTAVAATPQVAAAAKAWTPGRLAWLVILVALAVVAALPSWQNVAFLAMNSAEYSHMLIVLPVFAFLLWQRREELARVAPSFSLWGPAIALTGVAMDFVGFASQIDVLKDLGMVAMFVGAVVTVTGVRWPMRALPAFGVLLFFIPMPGRVRQQIAQPLQEVSAWITAGGMELIGQPVIRFGSVLEINGIQVAVAEACNGMRMVMALALVAYAFVFVLPLRPWARVTILLMSPLVAIFANVLRLGPTVLFYGYADEELADFAHDVSGWLVLLVALGVLWGFVGLCRWLEIPIEPERSEAR